MTKTTQHPHHDELTNLVRSWYVLADEGLNRQSERREFGYYCQNASVNYFDVHVIEAIQQDDIPRFLADVQQFYQSTDVGIFVHGKALDAQMGPLLIEAGCTQDVAKLYLTYVGDAPPDLPPAVGITLEKVNEHNLIDYERTKLKAFADSEDEPTPERLERGLRLRQTEMNDVGRFMVGRVDGEAAAIIGWYTDEDQMIFHLATRVPFRNRGLARRLLNRVIRSAYQENCRSISIFTDPADTPVQLYHKIGFTDEIYWMGKYNL
ncbi:MAG: GNAT family N-acetyltransferase [Chloroflexota bacterium]